MYFNACVVHIVADTAACSVGPGVSGSEVQCVVHLCDSSVGCLLGNMTGATLRRLMCWRPRGAVCLSAHVRTYTRHTHWVRGTMAWYPSALGTLWWLGGWPWRASKLYSPHLTPPKLASAFMVHTCWLGAGRCLDKL
jgi:hypothetical protein